MHTRTRGRFLEAGSAVLFALALSSCSDSGTAASQDLSTPGGPDLSTPSETPDMAAMATPDLTTGSSGPLAIGSIAPAAGINNAATPITITGTGFQAGAKVTVGGQTCGNPTVTSPTTLTCVVPAKAATCGAQAVVVTNPDTQSATSATGFAYFTSAVTWGTPIPMTAPTYPHRPVVADLNTDGKLDVVVHNSINNSVTVYLGKGDGSFGTPNNLATGGSDKLQTGIVVVDDLNGDKKPDLVALNATSTNLSIFLGNGDGTFKTPLMPMPSTVTTTPSTMEIGDLDGDKKPDLLLGDSAAAQAAVLLGNGDGTFKAGVIRTLNGTVSGLALADLNADGKLDAIGVHPMVAGKSSASIYLGNGDGTFKAGTNNAVGTISTQGTGGQLAAAGDLNADGKLDVLVANSGDGTISVLAGNGDGSLQAQKTITVGNTPRSFAIADLNADGTQDILVGNWLSGDVSYLQGMGNLSYAAPVNTASGGGLVWGIAVADFNGDKLLDLTSPTTNPVAFPVFLQQCK